MPPHEATPKDWTQPVDYRDGTLHIRQGVLEKPAGGVPTTWSIRHIPIKGQNNNHGCASSPTCIMPGAYEKEEDMTRFWENDSIVRTDGITMMTLVTKAAGVAGKNRARLRPDLSEFLPTRIHVTPVQEAKGSTCDRAKAPGPKGELKAREGQVGARSSRRPRPGAYFLR
jgi:hypothetical protein